jgi:hypothetical protein
MNKWVEFSIGINEFLHPVSDIECVKAYYGDNGHTDYIFNKGNVIYHVEDDGSDYDDFLEFLKSKDQYVYHIEHGVTIEYK